jgi:hypothetical protein
MFRRAFLFVLILLLGIVPSSADEITNDATRLVLVKTIYGDISPKSVHSSGTG